MSTKLTEELLFQIYETISEIPPGKVVTYGQIASLIGLPKNARLIGKALSHASLYGNYPCHRVVNHQGRTTPNWKEQKSLLEQEQISFLSNGKVDMKKHQWQ